MPTLMIVRHTLENHLGVLVPVLEKLGLAYRYVEAYEPAYQDTGAFDDMLAVTQSVGVVVLGGPQHAMDDCLAAERTWLKSLVDKGIPVFGICLGSQMLSAVLGGTVHRNRHQEVGWVEIQPTEAGKTDPCFQYFAQAYNHRQFHWHNDSFTLPPGSVALASSETCPQQAFRYGDHVMAVQFHPEVSLDVIQGWLKESRNTPPEQKRQILLEAETSLDLGRSDAPIYTSVALFQAFCERHFL